MLQVADRRTKGQQGFTLIEIIAVLVILGILAVVAIPKYINLQDEARNSAAKGLIAAAQSQLSMGYAAMKLNSSLGLTPAKECAKVAVSSGEGNVSCTGDDWKANIPITANLTGMTTDVKSYWNSPEAN
ncbi:MAG: type II secretion system protein [Desulfovibrio sp.]